MALLEKISALQKQGIPESQIFVALKEEGFSPLQISEALNQSKIKSAVAPTNYAEINNQRSYELNQEELQPSIGAEQQTLQTVPTPEQNNPNYTQGNMMSQQAQYTDNQYASEQDPSEQTDPNQGQYPYEGQAQDASFQQYTQQYEQGYSYPQEAYQPLDLETIRDLVKQEIEEATRDMKNQLAVLEKIRNEISFQTQNLENRMNRIEEMITTLQSSAIRRIETYSESIKSLQQEIIETQKAFSKVLGPIFNKRRGITEAEIIAETSKSENYKEESENEKDSDKSKKAKRNSESFEDYLR